VDKGLQSKQSIITSKHLLWTFIIAVSLIVGLLIQIVSFKFIIGVIFIAVAVVIIFKYPFLGLLIYMVIFLMRPAELYPVLAPLHLERIVGLLVLVISLIAHKRTYGSLNLPFDFATKMFLLFWIIMIISWTYSQDQALTYDTIVDYMKLVILYLIVAVEVNTRKRFDVFMAVFILLIAFNAFLSFRDYYGGGAKYRMGIYRAQGRTSAGGDPNNMAATLASTFPLVVVYLRYYKNLMIRLGGIAILLLFMLMVVNTGSRSGLIALIVSIGVLVCFSRYKMISFVVALFIFVAGWFVIPSQYQARYETVFNEKDTNEVSSGRIDIWKNALRMIEQHPFTGVGAGAFLPADASGKYGPPLVLQAHNLYLQLLATTGVIGTTVWFLFLGSIIKRFKRKKIPSSEKSNKKDVCDWFNNYRIGFLACLLSLLAAGFFGHSLYRYTWYLVATLSFTMLHIYRKEKSGVTGNEVL